jgi:hypothetical protein
LAVFSLANLQNQSNSNMVVSGTLCKKIKKKGKDMIISGDKKSKQHYIVGHTSTLTCIHVFIFLALKLN